MTWWMWLLLFVAIDVALLRAAYRVAWSYLTRRYDRRFCETHGIEDPWQKLPARR